MRNSRAEEFALASGIAAAVGTLALISNARRSDQFTTLRATPAVKDSQWSARVATESADKRWE